MGDGDVRGAAGELSAQAGAGVSRAEYLQAAGATLLGVLGGDVVMWNAVDMTASAVEVEMSPLGRAEAGTMAQQLGEVLDEHPMMPSYMGDLGRGLPRPRRLSDVASPAELRSNRAWVDVLRPAGWGHQLTILASPITPTATRGWAIARSGSDFPAEAVVAAAALQATLVVLDRAAGLSGPAVSPPAAQEEVADRLGLTPRELEVLGLMAEGLSSQQIGTALRIARRTAEKHRENIHRKLGQHDRMHAVQAARAWGLLPDGPSRLTPR